MNLNSTRRFVLAAAATLLALPAWPQTFPDKPITLVVGFSPGGGAFVDGSALLPDRLWTHVAVTYDGRLRRTYINGVLDRETGEQPQPLRAGPGELVIGADAELGAAFAGRGH